MNQEFMRRTFELARKGLGTTWPNPLVGCVIVKNGKIIGEGYHRTPGLDHAEPDALKNCTESPEGATLYVNLEPCCHTKKLTPPCAQRLVREKIAKVIISNLDPHPEVNGKGVELLRNSGIEVEHGLLKEEGEALNEVFFLAQRKRRAFVHLKLAATLDGKISLPSGESQWITGEKARAHVHVLRAHHQGIMIGAGTLRKDNPSLTVRTPGHEEPQPTRIVFTKSGNLPAGARLFTDENRARTLIYTQTDLKLDLPFIKVKSVEDVLRDLYQKKIINVLLEGGSGLASAFMTEGLVDRVSLYMSPSFLGQGVGLLDQFSVSKLSERPRLAGIQSEWLGEDLYLTGRITCSRD